MITFVFVIMCECLPSREVLVLEEPEEIEGSKAMG